MTRLPRSCSLEGSAGIGRRLGLLQRVDLKQRFLKVRDGMRQLRIELAFRDVSE